jgi:hypothetical protein
VPDALSVPVGYLAQAPMLFAASKTKHPTPNTRITIANVNVRPDSSTSKQYFLRMQPNSDGALLRQSSLDMMAVSNRFHELCISISKIKSGELKVPNIEDPLISNQMKDEY